MSSYEQELYRDYLMRRDRDSEYRDRSQQRSAGEERRSRELGSALPSGRFKPTSQRQPSALSEEKRRQLKGDGSYNIPDNIYHSSGYVTRPSDLGEDPLSAVRTLRNQIRGAAIRSRQEGLNVRAHLCDNACDRLSAAEGVLTTMTRERTGALLVGDNKKAQQIGVNMEK
ncbi:hypothetical protein OSTOST_13441, partial [Ostertagia ostertagi]